MANRPKNICSEPVKEVIGRIENDFYSDIILAGAEGTGKSVVLNEYVLNASDIKNPVINGTVDFKEYIEIYQKNVFELYHVSLIIVQMLLYIKRNQPDKYSEEIVSFADRINYILRYIQIMHVYQNYDLKKKEIGNDIYNNPSILLEEFLGIVTKTLNYENVTVVIDNFDTFDGANQKYQTYMYKLLKKYMRLIITVSDSEVLNSDEIKDELSKDASIVTINYSNDIAVVKEIIDAHFHDEYTYERVGLILSDETIRLIIEKTNGNLFDIIKALRYLYTNLSRLQPNQYDEFVIKYIDLRINKNPILTGHLKQIRKLMI